MGSIFGDYDKDEIVHCINKYAEIQIESGQTISDCIGSILEAVHYSVTNILAEEEAMRGLSASDQPKDGQG